jgi:hypothetical protein
MTKYSQVPEFHPSGYPYLLFAFVNEHQVPEFVLAINETKAMAQSRCQNARPVDVTELTANFGHKQTTNFLKKFGDKWICRSGKIYYQYSQK